MIVSNSILEESSYSLRSPRAQDSMVGVSLNGSGDKK